MVKVLEQGSDIQEIVSDYLGKDCWPEQTPALLGAYPAHTRISLTRIC